MDIHNVNHFYEHIKILLYSVVFIKKDKCIKPPPLMFSWECTNCLKQQKQPPRVFRIKGVLKKVTLFTTKHLCWSFFVVFVVNFIRKRFQHRHFLVNITKFLRTPILNNIWERRHLKQLF